MPFSLAEVCDLLKRERIGTRHSQSLFEKPVCAHAFCRLLGIGHSRFGKLKRAASDAAPLVDGRFVRKVKETWSENRVLVFEYLEELYQTLSEPAPEASERSTAPKLLRFRKRRGKAPKIQSLQRRQMKNKQCDGMKLLPPGTYSEYLALLQARHPHRRISLKLFSSEPCHCFKFNVKGVVLLDGHGLQSTKANFSVTCICCICLTSVSICHLTHSKVWTEQFSHKLAVRPRSQHKECGICVRHKRILRRLGNDRNGRAAQMSEYSSHLQKQFSDRSIYWAARAQSRLGDLLPTGTQTLAFICDAIDHTKFKFPRSECFQAKDLDSCQRPCLYMTACICHGHGVWLFPSLVHVCKDSNLMADLLTFCVDRILQSGRVDGRCAELLLQTDNTCREWKNNCIVRLLGAYTATHRLRRCELRCLLSGHSHEDVDQYFSTMSNHIQGYKELYRPADFKRCLEDLHQDGGVRQHEPLKEVHVVSSTRARCFAFAGTTFLFCV